VVLLVENGKAADQEAHNRIHFARASAEERQAAVDEADFLLTLDACKQYGLITGGPTINWHACMQIIELGKEHGITPTQQET
jgi:hypothetical protein